MITFLAFWALYGFAVLRLGPRWKFVRYLPMAIGGLIATAPIWSLAVMMMIWGVGTSCHINEGGPNPCLLLGVDFGGMLYIIGNLATWGFFVFPIFAIVGVIYVALHLPFFIVALRRDKAASPPEPKPRQVAVAAMMVIAILLVHAWYEAATAPSEAELNAQNPNWRKAVGTIPRGCPASVRRAANFQQLPDLHLTPEQALSAALATGKLACNTSTEQSIYHNVHNYYFRTPGSPLEVTVDGKSGSVWSGSVWSSGAGVK